MDATLPAVAEELLREIEKAFRETSHVPDDLLSALKFVFGASAVPALDLVDHRSVTRIVSPSGRTVYQANHREAVRESIVGPWNKNRLFSRRPNVQKRLASHSPPGILAGAWQLWQALHLLRLLPLLFLSGLRILRPAQERQSAVQAPPCHLPEPGPGRVPRTHRFRQAADQPLADGRQPELETVRW